MTTEVWKTETNAPAKDQANHLAKLIDEADALVIGVGAGMSASTGFKYIGERFTKNFPDFIEKYGLLDMLQASLFDFESTSEYWAFQSRFILLNYFDQPVGQAYTDMREILENKNKSYHIITTNADNAFHIADYDMDKVWHIQGEYGLMQCSKHCHQQTYQDEDLIRKMVEEQENMEVPRELIPLCPKCGAPLEVNKRNAEKGMVEDADFKAQEQRYKDFIQAHQGEKIIFLEIGIGNTTPQFVKQPFQQMTADNNNSLFVIMNQKDYQVPKSIKKQTLRFDADIEDIFYSINHEH